MMNLPWWSAISVGRSGDPSRDGRQSPVQGGSVGRVSRRQICVAALRAAGRSVGCTESETLTYGYSDSVGRDANHTFNFPPQAV